MKKIFLIVMVSFLNTSPIWAETDEIITPQQMELYTNKHKEWLSKGLTQLVEDVSKTNEVSGKLDKVISFRESIRKYFVQNDGQMMTEFRLEFRSLMDLYLAAFPTSSIYKSEDCSVYRSRFEEGAGKEKDLFSWTARETEKILNQVCVPK